MALGSPAGQITVLGLSGSPRRGGNTETLLDRALEGAAAAGARVEKLVIPAMNITPCDSCWECGANGVCIQQDDMVAVYPKLRQYEALFVASPVFFLGLTAQLKAMIDRCQALWIIKYRLGGRTSDSPRRRRGLFLAASNRDIPREFQPSIAVIKAFFATLDVQYFREVLVPGVDGRGDILAHPDALEAAAQAGRDVVLTPWEESPWVREPAEGADN